jgi:hypothetical protein
MLSARDNLISLASDLFKDANGIRPRGIFNWEAMSIADLEDLVDCLGHELEAIIVAEREWKVEEDRMWREDVALGIVPPTPDVELESWEIWEARAEAAGF